MTKTKNHISCTQMQIISLDGQCVKDFLQGVLNGKKNIHKLNGGFIKNYDDDSNKGYILEVDVGHLKNLLNPHGDLPFLAERKKIKKWLLVI